MIPRLSIFFLLDGLDLLFGTTLKLEWKVVRMSNVAVLLVDSVHKATVDINYLYIMKSYKHILKT